LENEDLLVKPEHRIERVDEGRAAKEDRLEQGAPCATILLRGVVNTTTWLADVAALTT
jgi:hypothetical protein